MIIKTLILGLSSAIFLWGCNTSYTITKSDESRSPLVRAAGQIDYPVALVVIQEENFHSLLDENKFGWPDIAPLLKSRLLKSELFQTVHYPVEFDDEYNLLLKTAFDLRVDYHGQTAPSQTLAIITAGLGMGLIEYDFTYSGTVNVELLRQGHQIKNFDVQSDVSLRLGIGANGKKALNESQTTVIQDLLDKVLSELIINEQLLLSLSSEQNNSMN